MEYYEVHNDKQISFRDMVFRILHNWRKIILLALIFTVVCGGYKLISQVKYLRDNTSYSASMNAYQNEYAKYEESKSSLEKDMASIKTSMKRQSEYNDNSLTMVINPFDEYVSYMIFYIDTDYKINPNLTYQSADNTKSIARAYYDTLNNGDVLYYILDNLSYKTEFKYLKEIVSVWPEYDTNMLYIKVVQKDKESCEEIMKLLSSRLMQVKESIDSSVGKHDLVKIQDTTQSIIDLDLDAKQKAYKQSIIDYDLSIKEKNTLITSLIVPVEPEKKSLSIGSIINYAMIGFVLGIFIEMLITVIALMTNNRLLSYKDFKLHYNAKIIGIIQKDSKKHIFGFIDNLINKLEGNTISQTDYNEEIRIACANLQALVKRDMDNDEIILCTGSAANDKMNEIYQGLIHELPNTKGIKLEFAENINRSAVSINKLAQCDAVILIEEIGHSTYDEISENMNNIGELDKKIIGVLLT